MELKLTVERLRELLEYDSSTGLLRWRISRGPVRAGTITGSMVEDGYLRVSLDGTVYRAHRLVWLYVHGRWPVDQLDHIDGDRANNRLDNLREADLRINNQNRRKAGCNSVSGLLGASPRGGKFIANIKVDGKSRYLGTFQTAELAHHAYVNAKRRLHAGSTL